MRAIDFSKPLNEKRLDPEMQRLYKRAQAHYPMYDEETALLKFLQRNAQHGQEKDEKLEKAVSKLDKRVTKLEKGKKK